MPSYLHNCPLLFNMFNIEVFFGADTKASKFVVKGLFVVTDGEMLVDFGYGKVFHNYMS